MNDARLQSFKRVELQDATRLGAPLFVGAALDSAWEKRCEELARACDRLRLTGAQDLIDLNARSFSAAGVPVVKEPTGLSRSDGKSPDGLSLVPWQNGKAVCLDVTVIYTLADSYISAATRDARAAAELAASRKEVKYAGLDGRHMFAPIAFENLAVPSASTRQLLSYLGRRLADISGESRETSYLFQRCSILVQRFNAVLLHDSLPDRDCTDY